jgi:hypothetical protein
MSQPEEGNCKRVRIEIPRKKGVPGKGKKRKASRLRNWLLPRGKGSGIPQGLK